MAKESEGERESERETIQAFWSRTCPWRNQVWLQRVDSSHLAHPFPNQTDWALQLYDSANIFGDLAADEQK